MASTGRRVFLSSGAPLTFPGTTSTSGQSDQSSAVMFLPSSIVIEPCRLLQRENPERPSIRHLGNLAGEQAAHGVHFSARVLTPARQYGDVLLPVHRKRSRRSLDSRT